MQKLFIAETTIRKHLYHIRKKLNVRNIRKVMRLQQPAIMKPAVSTLRFSPRGREVFMLAWEGLTELQMAAHLGISVSGVKRHKEKMLAQNGCKSMLELIAKYHGMADMNETNPDEDYPQD